ncbi:hypothetical protein IPH25_02525 [bacterium]|nr:MAG: hypothetical protein IPG37_04665 [bacterium]QQR62295.1 MAG: hypothetical protein IPH25_02525 [bacterium]QQR63137.1 MAG: hypothetical protein IPH67_01525 [bacterium]
MTIAIHLSALCECLVDLNFIFQVTVENHPGIYNTEDPEFSKRLIRAYVTAAVDLINHKEQQATIKNFMSSFEDPHFRVAYQSNKKIDNLVPVSRSIFFKQWDDLKTVYIAIPTFDLDGAQKNGMENLIQVLPSMRDNRYIIFDIRGNGGGSSFWGQKICQALFGKDYIQAKTYEYEKSTYARWRASKANCNYIRSVLPLIEKAFGVHSTEYKNVLKIQKGMDDALSKDHIFYDAYLKDEYSEDITPAECQCSAQIIVLIDQNCASATLDFLDRITSASSCTLIGSETGYDTVYMECRKEILPSKTGALFLPIKVYKNRKRKNRERYKPTIKVELDRPEQAVKEWFLQNIFQ